MAMEQPHSRGWYRRNAIHNMTGNTKMQPVLDEKTHEVYTDFNAVQFFTMSCFTRLKLHLLAVQDCKLMCAFFKSRIGNRQL